MQALGRPCAQPKFCSWAATGASQIAAVSLAVIASLTYPHAAVVAWMDHRQAVWRAQLRS